MNGADRNIASCGTHIVRLVLLRFETHHSANCVFVEGAGIIGGSGGNHLLVCSTVFVDISIVCRAFIVIGTVIDMVFYSSIVVRVDKTKTPRHQMQGERLSAAMILVLVEPFSHSLS